jgi:hypothetical protein
MAYMSQEHKKKIAVELKKVVPKTWKYTLSVEHHSKIVMNIKEGPKELLEDRTEGYNNIYHGSIDRKFKGELLETLKKIVAALNMDNYDNSDIMTDYFDVGHYVNINVGKWDKPFKAI